MGNPVKEYIQKTLYNRCHKKYLAEVERQSDRYAQLLLQRGEETRLSVEQRAQKHDSEYALRETEEAIVIYLNSGMPSADAFRKLDQEMVQKPWLLFAYGYEDFLTEDGRRHSPWCKPVWSPDTWSTAFYIGSLFAVRKKTYQEWERFKGTAGAEELTAYTYTELGRELAEFCLEKAGDILSNQERKQMEVLEAFLYHGFQEEDAADGWLPEEERFAASASGEKAGTISMIIPSKDNPEVLRTCIESVRTRTKITDDFEMKEIIVVDNGSSEENRAVLEQMSEELSFRYHYEPMDFNFSRMCNVGAAMAKGEYLLFLNDDIEVMPSQGEEWLQRMMSAAVQKHAGAVGAKLLYPDTDLIQHVGVTNLRVGPAHKLLKCSDSQNYYHGRNRGRQNMLAVTAACLLVAREKYDAVGGFYEGMAVSYNDVDFCFSLYEKGWYNIQCNDAVLYHHESLSRGDDNLSEQKWERLLQEKHTLYTRHPKLWKQDPFYSPLLAEHFSDYICSYEYEYERRDCYTGIRPYRKRILPEWKNDCLTVNVEHARRERKLDLTEQSEVYWIEGWSYVLGMDNCRYTRSILLTEEKTDVIYEAEALTRYREDVEAILPQQVHVALAGFVCRIPKEKLPAGSYRIAMLVKDGCSSQKLYRETEAILTVE
ncbi:MAG: glycosyltransferase family 2 protein [Lachnospiraceae bacterium]|nr:glycosyltransferase family 2 protein [Lachnospiraceae bacterium]